MDLERLRALRAVAHHGTVADAAASLHLTSSAVSQRIRRLSSQLGVTLLEPQGRGVRLTAAGRELVDHADAIHARWEQAKADVDAREQPPAGPLGLGAFPTAIDALVAAAAARVRDENPRLHVRVTETETPGSYGLLLAGDIDVAVVVALPDAPPRREAKFDQEPLLDDPQDLLVPADHALARRSSVRLEEAADEHWIGSRPDDGDHEQIRAACTAAGFSPDVVHHARDWSALVSLVGQGFGVSLIPRLARVGPEQPAVCVPLEGTPTPSRRILTVVRRGSRSQPGIRRGLAALRRAADAHLRA